MQIQFSKSPSPTAPLQASDKARDLSSLEIEAEDKALKLPKGKFTRIAPIPGTLAFMFRNIPGGNPVIIRALEVYLSEIKNRAHLKKTIDKFIKTWKNFDEFSQRRIDVFDWFCKTEGIDPCQLWGAISEGLFKINEAEIALELISMKPEVLGNVRKFARNERNFRDRELASKATNIIKDQSQISIDASQKTVNNNLTYSPTSFNLAIRENDEIIRGIPSREIKALPEAKEEFIDAEFSTTKENELCRVPS